MASSLVLTIVGPDRPGLVESIASLVTEHGGNWLESRMSRLGGHFAGILRAEIPPEQEAGFVRALDVLGDRGLKVVVVSDVGASAGLAAGGWIIDLVGQDRPGIVRQVARALASRGVNVEDLHTECVSAPMSGEALFKARALVQIPVACDVAALRRELEQIAADLIVDVSLRERAAGGTF